MNKANERRSYRFGPLERRGVVGSLRPGQVACLAVGCLCAVAVFRARPSALALVIALCLAGAGAGVALVPIAGRPLQSWFGVVAEWSLDGLRSQRQARSELPGRGTYVALDGSVAHRPFELPRSLADCRIVAVPLAEHDLGVLEDRRLRALTAVIAIRIRSVGLLPTSEHEARLERWGQILAGLARTNSPIRRLQILQRALPSDAEVLWRHYLSARVDVPTEAGGLARSYASLLDDATQVTQDHEVLLAVQVDERRAWARAARDASLRGLTRHEQAHGILTRELRTLASRFDPRDVYVAGLLTAPQYAAALRHAYSPFARTDEDSDGLPLPSVHASEAAWDRLHADGAWHRTYWIAQWPRLPVGPLFLTPLVLAAHAVHSVSVVLEPVAPARSRRAVEAAITSDEADEELRERRGFRTTARQRRQQEATIRREEELASGHEEVRLAGYVTVSGRTEAELDESCERVQQAAEQAYLDLQPLWGEQEMGFVNGALPAARGLRDGGLW
jgi:hypothetical protein